MTGQGLANVLGLSLECGGSFAAALGRGNSQAQHIPSHKNFHDVPPQPKGMNR